MNIGQSQKRFILAIAAAGSLSVFPAEAHAETAVLAGGCFWGVENVYKHVKGVTDVVSGYAGGDQSGLTRSQASDTGFAEAVRITFDPAQISYDQLLHIFFEVAHDPTQVNRQGPDIGPRYRSAIFPQNAQQRAATLRYVAALRSSGQFGRPIATKIESGGFEPADRDQQDYVLKHPREPYVIINDLPKLDELKRRYPQLWRA
jgi:peptide-methionine (S)-S-oxide reductase